MVVDSNEPMMGSDRPLLWCNGWLFRSSAAVSDLIESVR